MSEILQKGFDDAQGCTAVKNPREARLRWEAFGKVGNCRGTHKKNKKKSSGRERGRVEHRAFIIWCNKCDAGF